MPEFKIAPSLLAADFADLGRSVESLSARIEMLHIDVMDGHFVPNISFGMPVISAVRHLTRAVFDCHLMTTNPDAHLPALREAGADLVTMHIEAVTNPTRPAARARDIGLGFGLVVSPPTPIEAVLPFVDLCDMVLVMSVQPGFGGQEFMPDVLPKLELLRKTIESKGLSTDIQIDGGITTETAPAARDAGANVFVAGTAVFGASDPVAAVEALRVAIEGNP